MSKEKRLWEKRIDSKKIYQGKIVSLRLDEVELPNGRRSLREVVEHPGAVAVVPLTEKVEVILIKQFRVPTGEVLLEIPAGTLQPGEEPEKCAQRELEEEIGYRAGNLKKLFSSYLAPGYSSENLHAYLATNLVPKPGKADADEFIEIVRVPLSKVEEMIDRGEIKDAKTLCALLMTARCWKRDKGKCQKTQGQPENKGRQKPRTFASVGKRKNQNL